MSITHLAKPAPPPDRERKCPGIPNKMGMQTGAFAGEKREGLGNRRRSSITRESPAAGPTQQDGRTPVVKIGERKCPLPTDRLELVGLPRESEHAIHELIETAASQRIERERHALRRLLRACLLEPCYGRHEVLPRQAWSPAAAGMPGSLLWQARSPAAAAAGIGSCCGRHVVRSPAAAGR